MRLPSQADPSAATPPGNGIKAAPSDCPAASVSPGGAAPQRRGTESRGRGGYGRGGPALGRATQATCSARQMGGGEGGFGWLLKVGAK